MFCGVGPNYEELLGEFCCDNDTLQLEENGSVEVVSNMDNENLDDCYPPNSLNLNVELMVIMMLMVIKMRV